jgi:hypothetical protein
MTDQQDRRVDLTNHSFGVLTVAAAETTQGVRWSDDPHVFADEFVIQTAKAGCIRERAVHENNSGISHF